MEHTTSTWPQPGNSIPSPSWESIQLWDWLWRTSKLLTIELYGTFKSKGTPNAAAAAAAAASLLGPLLHSYLCSVTYSGRCRWAWPPQNINWKGERSFLKTRKEDGMILHPVMPIWLKCLRVYKTWEVTTQIQDTTLRNFLSGSNCGRKISTTLLEFQANQNNNWRDQGHTHPKHLIKPPSFHLGDQPNLLFPFSRPESFTSFGWILIGSVFSCVVDPLERSNVL